MFVCEITTQDTAHVWGFDFNLKSWFSLLTMDSGIEFMSSCLCPMCFSPSSHISKLENFLLLFESESLISECRQFWFHLKTLCWFVVTLPHVLSRFSFVTAHHVNLMIALIVVSLKTVPLHSTRVGHRRIRDLLLGTLLLCHVTCGISFRVLYPRHFLFVS